MTIFLSEGLTPNQASLEVLQEDKDGKKYLCMKGIFLQGGVQNQNMRVYPEGEIGNAVQSLNEKIKGGFSVLGEVDHPEELTINLDRVSHVITEMWMDGSNGCGKLKLIPTPMGQIVQTMLESGVKLGVSSRGSGNVGHDGRVSEFDIVTIDVVAQPSAPNAYPNTIYESIFRNSKKGNILMGLAEASKFDPRAKHFLEKNLIDLIKDL